MWFGLWYVSRGDNCPAFSLFTMGYMRYCFISNVCLEAFRIQVFLCAFNLFFPVYPLDGGKIFITLMIMCCKITSRRAAQVCIGVSTTLATALFGFSIYSKNWFSALLCLWIFYQIYQMYDYLRSGRISEHPLFEHAPGGFYNPVVEQNKDGAWRARTIN